MALTNAYLQSVMEKVIARNPGEAEFHQAVAEVLESLEPVVEKRPEFITKGVIDEIVEHLDAADENWHIRTDEQGKVLNEDMPKISSIEWID